MINGVVHLDEVNQMFSLDHFPRQVFPSTVGGKFEGGYYLQRSKSSIRVVLNYVEGRPGTKTFLDNVKG
jgi:hypothetical protein